ncbi:MAG TPA: BTAD domain-containing putative transcriptional regulator [Nitriliruptoraceae bacterium]|nr:BTAD domain-containing putative transcriptional regulator [Nitriliruptoraceae bacterium]
MRAYRVLGAVQILDQGVDLHVGGERQRRLLAMLLVHRNETVSTHRLVHAVFAGEPTPRAEATLRTYVARLRRVLEEGGGDPGVLETRPPGYVLWVPDEAIDAGAFEAGVTGGRALLDEGDPAGALAVLREALGGWGGEPYAEFDDEDWARPEIQRLDHVRLAAEDHLLDAELACGLDAEVVARTETLVAQHPLRESFRAKLMTALYRSGQQVEALRAMQEYREILATDFGLDPAPALVDLEHRILVHDRDLQMRDTSERVIRGYRLGARLGSGRDGTVHAARLPGVDRDLAIRIVPPEIADRPDVVRSFEANHARVAALHDVPVVPIHDHWREPGAAYVVMRRMDGGSLRDRLEDDPLSVVEVAALARRLVTALDAVHEQGMVHGRVTAASVLLDASGAAALSDVPLGSADASQDDDVAALVALVIRTMASGVGAADDAREPRSALLAQLEDLRAGPPRTDVLQAMVACLDRAAGVEPHGDVAWVNPYKGLRAFAESDAADFFGRDRLVDELLQRMASDALPGRFVLLVGASGSGKSSVVSAGLLPRVRSGAVPGSEHWLVATMMPGASPFKELAQGLASVATQPPVVAGDGSGTGSSLNPVNEPEDDSPEHPPGDSSIDLVEELARDELGITRTVNRLLPDGTELLLVIDQFEDLFTRSAQDEQRRFIAGLVHAVADPDSRVRFVATLRADFYDRPLRFRRLGALVRGATVTVPAMRAAELEATIVGPARRVGLAVEAPLVAELVAAVIDQPAAMPSLQLALYDLAAGADGGGLTLAAHRALGGVGGAIATRAEALYRSLDDDHRQVRRLFERLVVIGADGTPARRRTPRSELALVVPGKPVADLVEPWVEARLVTHDHDPETRAPTIEVAHEALLREWPRLSAWIEEDRGAIEAAGKLRIAAREWDALDRDPGALYAGSRLEQALAVFAGRTARLPPIAREFLVASTYARDEARRQERELHANQERTNRRLRLQLAGVAAALVVAVIGGFLALDQRRRAQGEQRVAVARELAAASVASLDEDPELSILVALAAVDQTRNVDGTVVPEAHAALHEAVTSSRIVLSVPGLGGAVDWSPDGSMFVTEGPEETGLVDIRDATTGASVRAFTGHDVDINDVVFSPDGALVATAGDDGAAKVWDVASGEEVAVFDHDGAVVGLSFNADGRLLAGSWRDEGTVRVLDLDSGDEVGAFVLSASSTSFAPDDDRLVMAAGQQAVVVDTVTGERLVEVTVEGGAPHPLGYASVQVATWSPDGRWIATAGTDRRALVWDADTGDLRASMSGHDGAVVGAAWAPDSARLATSGEDGTARVWDVSDGGGTEVVRLSARDTQGVVSDVAFSPDGQQLLTGDGAIRSARVWDVAPTAGAEVMSLPGQSGVFSALDFGDDGTTLVASRAGTAGTVWELATGEQVSTLGPRTAGDPDHESWRMDLSPDGELVATAGPPGVPVRVWDARSGVLQFTGDESAFTADAAWSPDGRKLAAIGSTADQGWITIFDPSGRTMARFDEEAGFSPVSLAFDPSGERLVTTRRPLGRMLTVHEGLVVRDASNGAVLRRMPAASWAAVFDPTGELLVANDLATGAAVWDPDTGERIATLTGHTGQVSDVAVHPAGRTVATASLDGTVRLWDLESGSQTLVLRGSGGPVGAVAFGSDGTTLASSAEDEVRVWTLDLDELVTIAHQRVTRTLTDDECDQFLHVDVCP